MAPWLQTLFEGLAKFGLHPLTLRLTRLLAAVVGLVVGSVALSTGFTEEELGLALVVVGALGIAHLLIDLVWAALWRGQAGGADTLAKLADAAQVYIGTPGVVIGLILGFAKPPFSTTLKAAAVSLAVTLVSGIILHGLAIAMPPTSDRARVLVGYLFSLLFWSLSFGIFCAAFSLLRASG